MSKKEPTEKEWTKKNTRQLLTWAYLYGSKELGEYFLKSETVKLNTLTYWQNGGSGLNRATARPLAIGLHDLILAEAGARYEDSGMTYSKAIAKLVDTLVDEEATVRDLSCTVDKLFQLEEED